MVLQICHLLDNEGFKVAIDEFELVVWHAFTDIWQRTSGKTPRYQ